MELFDALIIVGLVWAVLTLVSLLAPSSTTTTLSSSQQLKQVPKSISTEEEAMLQENLPDYRDHEFLAEAVRSQNEDSWRQELLQAAKSIPLSHQSTVQVSDIYDTLTSQTIH